MNTSAVTTAITLLLFSGASARSNEISIGKKITSPDKRFTVTLANDEGGNLHIIDNRTGDMYKARALTPVYFLKWTKDSQSFVTIEHLAGGSQAAVVHFTDKSWSRLEVDPTKPPPPYHHYAVIAQQIEQNEIRLNYKVRDEEANGIPIRFYICTLTVDARTGTIRDLKEHDISAAEYRELKLKRD